MPFPGSHIFSATLKRISHVWFYIRSEKCFRSLVVQLLLLYILFAIFTEFFTKEFGYVVNFLHIKAFCDKTRMSISCALSKLMEIWLIPILFSNVLNVCLKLFTHFHLNDFTCTVYHKRQDSIQNGYHPSLHTVYLHLKW